MEIEQSFRVPFAPEQVWASFHDTAGIVACLPGAAITAPPVEGQLKLSMTVKLGPIVAAFAGDGQLVLNDASRTGSVSGSGSDRKSGSRVKGEAAFRLHDESAATQSTRVDVQVTFVITGALAQFSRDGIVRDLAERMTAAFSANLKAKLEAERVASPVTVATLPAAEGRSASSEAPSGAQVEAENAPTEFAHHSTAPLDLGGMFWPMLIERLKRLFGFGKHDR